MAWTRIAYANSSLPFCGLFACAGRGWKNRCGVQAMTWYVGVEKLVSALASVDACSFCCLWLKRWKMFLVGVADS